MRKRSAVALCLGLTLTLTGCARQLEAPVQQGQKAIQTQPATAPGSAASQPGGDPGPAPVKTGTVTINLQAMKDLQAQVDQGHQPWRLDPLQVAMSEARQYGLDPAKGDQFTMLAPVKQGKPDGQAQVEVRHGGLVYVVELIQPNGPSPTGIWAIQAIRLAQ